MKSITLKISLAAITLAFAVSSVSAASPNGPKPRCHKLNEIPVLVNGSWVCKQPSISAGSSSRSEASATHGKITAKKPQRARPDYIITKVSRSSGNPKQLTITVKNIGAAAKVTGSEIFATVMNSELGTAAVAMPYLKADQSLTTFINFNKAPDRGAKIRVMADGNKRIPEKNENNNVKSFTY
ncbi:hypothetical protein OAV62_01365 [bacterium]|nr:hypothetical protein [bacterium]